LTTVASITLVIAGFLVLASVIQPAAERLHLPYTVLLAIVGVAIGAASSFLLYTPLTSAFDDIVRPVVNLPFNASIFLVVFLPLLLFHAALTIDVREIAPDWAPILTLAIVAVFAAAAAIGFSLSWAAGVPLTAALLLGAVVATTDPAAVVTIFRELGAPARLTRLLEGESLLNDAAAIVLFSVLVGMLADDTHPDFGAGAARFFEAFLGGVLLGVPAAAFGAILPFLGGSRLAE
jgi:CPA1 family monovalent cation:H+ antiporter